MGKSLKQMIRPLAGVLTLAFAVASSAECLAMALTPAQKACCEAMNHDCGKMAIEASCCPGDRLDIEGVVASKPAVGSVPVVALIGILSAPSISVPIPARFAVRTESSSAGPPGIPTYLFVSSFRI